MCTEITCTYRFYQIKLKEDKDLIDKIGKLLGKTAKETEDYLIEEILKDPKFAPTESKCGDGCKCEPNVPDDDDGEDPDKEKEKAKLIKNGKKTRWRKYSKDFKLIDAGTGKTHKEKVKFTARSVAVEGQCVPNPDEV